MLIGRDKEIKEIIDTISQRKNMFLSGPGGVGKSFIIKYVLDETGGNGVLYSDDCTTIKTTLVGFLKGDYGSTFLSCQNVASLKKLFYKKIQKERPYLVFDHTGRVGPKFFSYLENLLDDHPVLIIARSTDPGDIGDLSLLLFSFEKLEVQNQNIKHAYELITHFIDSYGLVIDKVDYFRKEVFRLSCGNPAVISEICQYAKRAEYKVGDEMKLNLLNLDRKIDALKL